MRKVDETTQSPRQAIAREDFLARLFKVPADEKATLIQLEKKLTENLHDFLSQSKVSGEIPLDQLADQFSCTELPESPKFVADHVHYLLENVIPYCVHTGSPKFIGHMTSALPYFLVSLAKCLVSLHQNVVKIETSRSFTLLERNTLGIIHRLIFKFNSEFYYKTVQNRNACLGQLCSGGTIANISALWVARNQFAEKTLGPNRGADFIEALLSKGYQSACVIVSKRGHYSFSKAVNLLGLGSKGLIHVPVNGQHQMDIDALERILEQCQQEKRLVLAIVGVAGSTETGSIDPLEKLAEIAQKREIWFHVDAAWGGPILFSDQHRHRLQGIEQADSVCIDGHKQLYLPMGSGAVLFKNPSVSDCIQQKAEYIIRRGSFDLGKRHLEGSRPGMALLMHAALHIFGKKGYELLMNLNQSRALEFAELIKAKKEFELISAPELNILTYRYNPWKISTDQTEASRQLDLLNTMIQKTQRERGLSFVSRTRLRHPEPNGPEVVVFRSVLANPLTQKNHLVEILTEQSKIAEQLLASQKEKLKELNQEMTK